MPELKRFLEYLREGDTLLGEQGRPAGALDLRPLSHRLTREITEENKDNQDQERRGG